MVRVLKKNKICSQMYEVLDIKIGYVDVVWKITIELNKSHENNIQTNESKPEEQKISSKSLW
jgi:hypothetical protein